MIYVGNCCKCVDLKKGSVIIGAFTIAFLIVAMVFVCQGACGVPIGSHMPLIVNDIFGFICIALFIIAGILLIVGIYQGKKKLILAYLVIGIIVTIIVFIFMCDDVAYEFMRKRYVAAVLMLISVLFFIGLQIYFLIVVNSYYKKED